MKKRWPLLLEFPSKDLKGTFVQRADHRAFREFGFELLAGCQFVFPGLRHCGRGRVCLRARSFHSVHLCRAPSRVGRRIQGLGFAALEFMSATVVLGSW